jgi:hypothetical protein
MSHPPAVEAPPHPQQKRVRNLLGIALGILVLHLAFGHNPWQDGIAEAVRKGKPILTEDIADTWLWWAAAGNAVLVAILLATLPRWLRRVEASEVRALAPSHRGKVFAVLVAAAVLVGAVFLQPRLSFSWWDDEEYTVRRHIDGRWAGLGTDELFFRRVPWKETLWKNNEGNNHIAFTILSRISLGTWRLVARPDAPQALEAAVRLPSYLAALGAVLATALLGWRLGFAAVGVGSAWLLTLHPWFVRYGAEARGYAMVLLLVPTVWVLLLNALHRGTWGRWLAFGAAQTLLMCTHMGTVMLLIATNAAAAVGLVVFHRGTPALREQGARFLVTNLLSAGLWAQLMLPNFVQMLDYLDDWRGRFGVPAVEKVLGHLLAGIQMKTKDPRHVTLTTVAQNWPLLLPLVAGGGAFAATAGALRLAFSGAAGRLILPAVLLPAPAVYMLASLREDRFYEAYLGFALPGLVLLVAAGLTLPFARMRSPLGPRLAAAVLATFIAGYAVLTQAPRESLRAGSFVTGRESVLVTRPSLDPFAPENQEILTASFSWPPVYYDPLVRGVYTLDKLRALMEEADRRGIPLFINNGRPHQALQSTPEMVAFVEGSDRFEKVADLPGFEKRGHRIVYRYLGSDGPDAEQRQTP